MQLLCVHEAHAHCGLGGVSPASSARRGRSLGMSTRPRSSGRFISSTSWRARAARPAPRTRHAARTDGVLRKQCLDTGHISGRKGIARCGLKHGQGWAALSTSVLPFSGGSSAGRSRARAQVGRGHPGGGQVVSTKMRSESIGAAGSQSEGRGEGRGGRWEANASLARARVELKRGWSSSLGRVTA